MRLIEVALFRLCLDGKLTLEQAKVLNSLYFGGSLTFFGLSKRTGLDEQTLFEALSWLANSGLVSEKSGFYFLSGFEGKLLELIDCQNNKVFVVRKFESRLL